MGSLSESQHRLQTKLVFIQAEARNSQQVDICAFTTNIYTIVHHFALTKALNYKTINEGVRLSDFLSDFLSCL